jgi:iron complex outermembrane receptor protein
MKKKVIPGLLVTTVLASSGAWAQTDTAAATDNSTATATAAPDTTDAAPVQSIVVSGIRQALQSARNKKRDSVQFVDAIVADDIGKLPDKNVAESLSRVSGIQVDRGVAEGSNVSIRGLRQNVLLYNGREIVDSTGRGGTGLDQLGTSTFGLMALVPSGLISSLEVTKLAGAEQIAGGLGGVIDIRSRMPLDGPEQIAGKVGMGYDALPGKTSPELFGLMTRKFANNEIGVLGSVFYERRSLAQQGLDTFSGYKSYTDTSVSPSVLRFGNQDARASEIEESRKKFGFNAVVQWRPNKDLELTGDTFFSRLESDRDRYWIGFNPTAGLSNATYSANNVLLSGRTTGPVMANTEYADISSDISSTALRAKFTLSDKLKGTAEASYGKSSSSYHQLYFRLQPLANITSYVDFNLTKGDFGAFNVGGVNLADINSLRQTIMFDSQFEAETKAKAVRADFKRRLDGNWLESLEFGARYNHLDSNQDPAIGDIRPAGGITASSLNSFLTTRNTGFSSGDFDGLPGSYVIPSKDAFTGCAAFTAFPAISKDPQCLNAYGQLGSVAARFRIKEEFTEAYAKLNMSGEVAGAELSGNVGVRFVQRKLESTGNLINSTGQAVPNTVDRTDSNALPSGVLKLQLAEDSVVRFGAAKALAFANTADLYNGVRLYAPTYANGVLVQAGTGTGGSPQLNPFKANQYDLSLEHYFGKQAMASLGFFRKDVSSFIVQKQIAEVYDGETYLVNRKINGEGAKVSGVEALLQLPFYFLPGPFDNFGIMATYSYIDSTTPVKDITGASLAFPGLSKNNANLVAYYEQGPISTRLAVNWRNQYLVGISAAATGIYNDSYTDVSATVRYDLTKNLSLNLEANNLSNSKQRTYDGTPEALRTNAMYGRIYKVSISAKF